MGFGSLRYVHVQGRDSNEIYNKILPRCEDGSPNPFSGLPSQDKKYKSVSQVRLSPPHTLGKGWVCILTLRQISRCLKIRVRGNVLLSKELLPFVEFQRDFDPSHCFDSYDPHQKVSHFNGVRSTSPTRKQSSWLVASGLHFRWDLTFSLKKSLWTVGREHLAPVLCSAVLGQEWDTFVPDLDGDAQLLSTISRTLTPHLRSCPGHHAALLHTARRRNCSSP